jgi:capsular polysaccharide biosynthesis protein
MVAPAGGSLASVSPAERVTYDLPAHASDEIRAFLRPYATIDFAPGAVARLPGGRVVGPGIVLSPDGQSLARDVSVDFGKAFADHWLLTSRNIKPPTPIAGTTAVIASALGAGYGHWLLDELPRLLRLGPAPFDSLIAHVSQPFSRAALTLHGFAGRIVVPGRYTHFQCDDLVVPGLVGQVGHPSRETVRLLADFAAPLARGSSPFGERLYLTREHARRRRVTNESVLWPVLEAAGFAKVALENLSWAEQINAFRQAKMVVAAHGAGLANLVFCQPGTKVVELFNRSYLHWTYWQIAALQSLDYRPLVASGAGPVSHTMASNRLDIEVDVGQVMAAVMAS